MIQPVELIRGTLLRSHLFSFLLQVLGTHGWQEYEILTLN